MKAARVLAVVRDTLRRCANAIDARLYTPDPPQPNPEEMARLMLQQRRKEQRASRSPWYARRQHARDVPEWLKYFEDVHGTKATLEMLRKIGRKHRGS